jgi:hypothetical protein
VFRHERLGRRGSPDDPVGPAAIVRKFDDCVRGVLSEADAASLRGLVMRLDTLDDTGVVSALLRSKR